MMKIYMISNKLSKYGNSCYCKILEYEQEKRYHYNKKEDIQLKKNFKINYC